MADEGYYELQVLDHAGWSLRSRFPSSEEDPLVLMRARAEAEQVTQEPQIKGVELVHEFLDAQTNEIKREAVFTWGNQRVAPVSGGGATAGGGGGGRGGGSGVASTPQSRRNILRAARAGGRLAERVRPTTRPGRRGKPTSRPKDEPDAPVAAPAAEAPAPPRRMRRRRVWWRSTPAAVLGSLLLAAAAGGVIWLGLSKDLSTAAALDTQPVQAGLLTVILLGAIVALVLVARRGVTGLFAPARAAAAPADGPLPGTPLGPTELAVPAPVAPMGPKPKAMAPEDAVVEVQQNRLLRFLRECMLHKDMRAALAADGTLRDPHIVFGVHLFLLGAAEVCVTDTSSGVSDRAHLIRVMKA
ncbi:MAG: hypothetical protein JO021_06120, partial [Alphaproteobacteria bacterium]|nr:hypothetical protein [Alphaproteobacteria bacterium]